MKPLFISNYGDQSGWAEAARNYILCMDSVGIPVVPRRIRFDAVQTIPERILELEKNTEFDTIIQNVLPHMMEYIAGYKNIGLFFHEVDSLIGTDWDEHLNLMDEVWVGSEFTKSILKVKPPVRVIPPPIPQIVPDTVPIKEQIGCEFLFYTVGEFSKRKNYETLLRAFHEEFEPEEPVGLVIKTSGNEQEIKQFCDIVRSKVRKFKQDIYRKPVIVTQNLPKHELLSLCNSCDVFVSASHGEGLCIPAIEAMSLAKPLICPDHTSFNYTGWKVKSYLSRCYDSDQMFNLYNYYTHWYDIDIEDLKRCMRESYTDRLKAKKYGLEGLKHNYTYAKVGALMC